MLFSTPQLACNLIKISNNNTILFIKGLNYTLVKNIIFIAMILIFLLKYDYLNQKKYKQ